MKNMVYPEIEVDKVNEAPYNPRKIDEDELRKLEKSIVNFGIVRPLIINKRNGVLISGHQTCKVLEGLGYKKVPYIEVDLDETKEKQLNLALNRISGDWDYPKLKELLDEFSAVEDFDFEITGFDDKEVEKIISELDTSNTDNTSNTEEEDYFTAKQKNGLELVQLYFDKEQKKEFIKKIEEIGNRKGCKNVTEAVKYCVDYIHELPL